MAFRAAKYWRTMLNRMGESRTIASSTIPKMKPVAPATDASQTQRPKSSRLKADLFPVYIVFGMILVAVSIGAHTAKQQIQYAPTVRLSKKKRESLSELDDPDSVVSEGDRFVNKSFLRKVGNIQEKPHTTHDPNKSVFTHGRDPVTLKAAGVNPKIA